MYEEKVYTAKQVMLLFKEFEVQHQTDIRWKESQLEQEQRYKRDNYEKFDDLRKWLEKADSKLYDKYVKSVDSSWRVKPIKEG